MVSTDFCIFGNCIKNNSNQLERNPHLNYKLHLYRNCSLISSKTKSKSIIKQPNNIHISKNFSDILSQDKPFKKYNYKMLLNHKNKMSNNQFTSSSYPKTNVNEVERITSKIIKILDSLNINSYSFSRQMNLKNKIAKKINLEKFLEQISAKYLSDKTCFVPNFSPIIKRIIFSPQNKIINYAKDSSKLHARSPSINNQISNYPTFKAIVIKKASKNLSNKSDYSNSTENKNLIFESNNVEKNLWDRKIISSQNLKFTKTKSLLGYRSWIFHRKALSRVTNLNLNLDNDKKDSRNTYYPELNRSNV